MKHEKKKLVWLGILFIVTGGIIYVTQEARDSTQDMITSVQNAVVPPSAPSLFPAEGFSTEGALSHLSPLITSGSVEKIGELLASLPIEQAEKIVVQIIDNQSLPLDRDDRIQLLSNLAFLHKSDPVKQGRFFTILIENKQFHDGEPLLFAIAAGDYQKVIPDLLEWLDGYDPNIVKVIAQDAINYAIEHNKFAEFDRLYNYGIFIPPHQATTLLWEAVDRDNNYLFITRLIEAGANVNTVYEKDGKKYTPLILAAKRNNVRVVKELLKAGADVNLIPDPAVGSALQVAVVKKFGEIDLLLREHGARE